ncbi:IS1 family transposase [Phototrophicus methaneseepsis]|uniref:IS1 family transposase n=1 Tax=Phototrophicus methaneseepsis TaxID=2710758 RepID=UPI0039C98897
MGWCLTQERDESTLQALLDKSPQAVWYYSDLFVTYKSLIYTPGTHTPMPDKSETFRVEGVNAELRHYLKRLVRKTRCFSKCIQALRRTVKLFVFAWNRRQLYRQQYPDYPAYLIQIVYP